MSNPNTNENAKNNVVVSNVAIPYIETGRNVPVNARTMQASIDQPYAQYSGVEVVSPNTTAHNNSVKSGTNTIIDNGKFNANARKQIQSKINALLNKQNNIRVNTKRNGATHNINGQVNSNTTRVTNGQVNGATRNVNGRINSATNGQVNGARRNVNGATVNT
jgi:hypothetical protein